MIMVLRFWAVLGVWLVDAFESSSPSRSAQKLQGHPVPVRIQCIRVLARFSDYYYLRIIIFIVIIMRSWTHSRCRIFGKCRHTKSVPIMGLKVRN